MRKLSLLLFLLVAVVLTSFQIDKINDNRSKATSESLDPLNGGIVNGELAISVQPINIDVPVSPIMPGGNYSFDCKETDKFCYWSATVVVKNNSSLPISNVKISSSDLYFNTDPNLEAYVENTLDQNWFTSFYDQVGRLKTNEIILPGPFAPNTEVWVGKVMFDYDANPNFVGSRRFVLKVEPETGTSASTLTVNLTRQPGQNYVNRFPPYSNINLLGIVNKGDFQLTQLSEAKFDGNYIYNSESNINKFLKECPKTTTNLYCLTGDYYALKLVNTSGRRLDSVTIKAYSGANILKSTVPIGSPDANGDYWLTGPFENGQEIGKFLFSFRSFNRKSIYLSATFRGQINGDPFGLPNSSEILLHHRYWDLPSLTPTATPTPTLSPPTPTPAINLVGGAFSVTSIGSTSVSCMYGDVSCKLETTLVFRNKSNATIFMPAVWQSGGAEIRNPNTGLWTTSTSIINLATPTTILNGQSVSIQTRIIPTRTGNMGASIYFGGSLCINNNPAGSCTVSGANTVSLSLNVSKMNLKKYPVTKPLKGM